MINVLITGAGSVMGQSVFRALAHSQYAPELNVFYTNSEPEGAGFFLNSHGFYGLKVRGAFLVPLARSEEYLPAVRRICGEREIHVVFGGTEHEIYALARLQAEPEFRERVATLPLPIVELTTDKFLTGEFFRRHAISAARTALLSGRETFVKSVPGPYVVKPRVSSASRNVAVIATAEELLRLGCEDPGQMVVQEQVGTAAGEYTAGCYVDRQTQAIAVIVMRRRLALDGASVAGVVVDEPAIAEYCRSIVRALMREGLEWGPVNIQLRMHGGAPSCFEINGRFSSTEGPRAVLGFNAPEAAIENLVFRRAYERFAPQIGMRFLRYYEEVYSSAAEEEDLVRGGRLLWDAGV